MGISPQLFAAVVSGFIRLGRAGYAAYQQRLLSEDIGVLLPPAFPLNEHQLRDAAIDDIQRNAPELLEGEFEGLVRWDEEALVANFDRPDLIEKAKLRFGEIVRASNAPAAPDPAAAADEALLQSPVVMVEQHAWMNEKAGHRRVRFGKLLASIAFNVIGAQPDVLGFNRRVSALVAGLAPRLDALVHDDGPEVDPPQSMGERLLTTFFQSTLETISERPDLFVPEDRWAPLISGMVDPLHAHVMEAGAASEIFAFGRLQQVMRGPLAHGVLTALCENADDFLTSRFASDEVLGAVTRTILGEIAATNHGAYDILHAFGPRGVVLVYDAALNVAQTRPELFIGGEHLSDLTKQNFLSRLAGALDPQTAPRPFSLKAGLGAQIATISFEVAGEYASTRLRRDADDSAWAGAGLDAADIIIKQVVDGFSAITGPDATDAAGPNPFERLFTGEQAVDLLRILAVHIAQTPSMVVGEDANGEVNNIAKGLATVFAHQTAGLLDGDDWRMVVTTAMGLVAANPGALFSLDQTASPESHVAVTLMSAVLNRAAANMEAGRQRGAILFGRTLREALIATIQAASNSLFASSLADDGDDGASRLAHHANALERFIDASLQLGAGDDRAFRMSADEWLHVFRYFVAHVVSEGPAALEAVDGEIERDTPVIDKAWILSVLHEYRDSDARDEGAKG